MKEKRSKIWRQWLSRRILNSFYDAGDFAMLYVGSRTCRLMIKSKDGNGLSPRLNGSPTTEEVWKSISKTFFTPPRFRCDPKYPI